MPVKLKVCGLFRPEDIEYVNEAMPDYCGFVIGFPRSHRNVSPQQVRVLRAALAKGILPIGVFVDQPIHTVAELVLDGTLHGVQLHGREDEIYIQKLRQKIGNAPIMKAFPVKSAEDVEAALKSTADYILLDSGQGSGQTFDWSLLAKVTRPFFLAGGLGPDNLERAMKEIHPWGVDLSSGVEENRIKVREKILAVAAAVKRS